MMVAPLLCVTVTGETTAEMRRRRDEVSNADLVELRVDSVRDPDAAGALADRRCRVIVTCRPTWEGGGFRGSEEERKRILVNAVSLGAEYVDIEAAAGWGDLISQRNGRGILLSRHDFDGMPANLDDTFAAMQSTGAEIVKAAVRVRQLADCVTLRDAATRARQRGNVIALGMGEHGLPTRILASRLGSYLTYAGNLQDIGQITPHSLLHEYDFRSISDTTQLYGVVGGSVAHSVSPAMHNAAFRALGVNAVYLPLPAVSADDFITFGRAFDISGASVTIPHKVTLSERLDEVDAVARRIGAINTIRVERGRWIGGNTDAVGFLQPLQDRMTLNHGLRASVLGAGGASRAVCIALASSGCNVRVHARRQEEAEQVAMRTSAEAGPWPPAPGSWDLLVNCTPAGQYPNVDETPIPIDRLTGRFVYDLVYNPTSTRLLREAAEMGCRTIGGLEMLVAQAREQFHWWTGARPPVSVMRDAALQRLTEFAQHEDHVI